MRSFALNMMLTVVATAVTVIHSTTAHAAQVKVLGDDTQALQTRIELINGAKNEILIEYFEVAQDKVTLVGLGLLQEAARRGVMVKILVDNRFSEISRAQFATLINTQTVMADGSDISTNFEIKIFNPMDNIDVFDQTYRNHDKLFVVDGKYAIIGGRNVSGSYFGRPDDGKASLRDVDVLIYGPEISQSKVVDGRTHLSPQDYFHALWFQNSMVKTRPLYEYTNERLTENCLFKYDRPGNCEAQQRLAIENLKKSQHEIDALLRLLSMNKSEPVPEKTWGVTSKMYGDAWLQKDMHTVDMLFVYNDPSKTVAKVDYKLATQLADLLKDRKPKDVSISTPYLFPTPRALGIFKSLIEKNGTHVKIITNSLRSTDSTLVHAAYESIKPQLLKFNTELYEYSGPLNQENQPTILHAKMMILDADSENPISLIGSFNLDQRSAMINREVGVMFSGGEIKALTRDLMAEIADLQANSIRSDGSRESNRKLLEMASPEKVKDFERDRGSLILLLPWLNKHI